MKPEFWHEKWQENRIGFHQADVNPFLTRHMQVLGPGPVFVPLCGKSRDMAWLREQGRPVIGVELSPLAVESFFRESGETPLVSERGRFVSYEVPGLTILAGDYFQLTPALLGPVGAAYDRAALIAMPPENRGEYAAHMATLLPSGASLLLVTLFSLKDPRSGPPFAVGRDEVGDIFGQDFVITVLECERETADSKPGLTEQGLAWREQTAYGLVRR